MKEQKPVITRIVLNEEQTRRFLSFFIPDAIRIASARLEQEAPQEQLIAGQDDSIITYL
ncbi:MAG: hypothetical protein JWM44_1984 [Bacilli bacterium]|nr:hypothetical protein [Bacilli bacterium]